MNPSENSTMCRSSASAPRSPSMAMRMAWGMSVLPDGCSWARPSSTTADSGTCCSGRTQCDWVSKASTPTVSVDSSACTARRTACRAISVFWTAPGSSWIGPPMASSAQWQAPIDSEESTTSASATRGRRSGSVILEETGSRSSSGVSV